jgi:plastocyanin
MTRDMIYRLPLFAVAILLAFAPGLAAAASSPETTVVLTLKDHRFEPAAFSVPAGVKVRINLTNLDAATEEFDSHDLKVEELVTPHGRASFTIGPLKPGSYSFMGEFHPATAQGRVTVTEGH